VWRPGYDGSDRSQKAFIAMNKNERFLASGYPVSTGFDADCTRFENVWVYFVSCLIVFRRERLKVLKMPG
jgi:hypothetical protein